MRTLAIDSKIPGRRMHGTEIRDVEAIEEVLFDMADAVFDAAFGKGHQLQPVVFVKGSLQKSPIRSIPCSDSASSC